MHPVRLDRTLTRSDSRLADSAKLGGLQTEQEPPYVHRARLDDLLVAKVFPFVKSVLRGHLQSHKDRYSAVAALLVSVSSQMYLLILKTRLMCG